VKFANLLCSKLENEVKLASFTLPLMDIYGFEDLSKIKCFSLLVKNKSFQLLTLKDAQFF
jgi:hypothetical protein